MREKRKVLKKLIVAILSLSLAFAFLVTGPGVKSDAADVPKGLQVLDAKYFNSNPPTVAVQYIDSQDRTLVEVIVVNKIPEDGNMKIEIGGEQYYIKLIRMVEGPQDIVVNSDGSKTIPADETVMKVFGEKPAVGDSVQILLRAYDSNDYEKFDEELIDITVPTEGKSTDDQSNSENGGENGGNKEDAKTITPPKGKKLVYTGKAQVGVEKGQGYTVTGNKAVKVGKYTAVAKLNKGNTWTDGTKDDKKIIYTIDPRTNSITVKKTKVTRNFKKKALKKMAKTFTLPKAKAAFGQKNLYYQFAKKPKTDKITLDKNGKVTLKKGLGKGTYSFTVKAHVPAGSTYTAATSKKINVKVVVK
jgi:hypothetical protein